MKKSQLRNIIRESIKGLMTEQFTPCSPAEIDAAFNTPPWPPLSQQCHTWLPCGSNQNQPFVALHPYSGATWNAFGIVGPMGPNEIYVNMGSPQVGQVVKLGNMAQHHWKYLGIQNNQNYIGVNNWFHNKSPRGPQHIFPDCSTAINAVYGCTDSTAFNYDSTATIDNGSCDYGWRCNEGKIAGTFGCYQGNATYPGIYPDQSTCQQVNGAIPNGCGPAPAGTCNKCCCQPQSPLPIGGSPCVPNTEIYLIPSTNPCQCPSGMIDCGGKPPMPVKMADPEIDRMKDLAFKGKR